MQPHASGGVPPAPSRVGILTPEPILAEGLAALLDAEPGLSCEAVPDDLVSALVLLEDGKVEALVVDEGELDPTDLTRVSGALSANSAGRVVVLTSGQVPSGSLSAALGSRGAAVDKRAGTAAVVHALTRLLV